MTKPGLSVCILLGVVTFGLGQSFPAPDFHLLDVNANSSRNNRMVSPRDYLLQVSGYYFGEAG
jgi:hypothetical protein